MKLDDLERALGGPDHTMRTLGTVRRMVARFDSDGTARQRRARSAR